jgi:hypothetical protein
MMMNRIDLIQQAKKNWFFVLFPIIFLANYLSLKMAPPLEPRLNEAAILFDLALLLPSLYAFCYRAAGRKIIIRTIAIACLGIWLAGYLIPSEEQVVYGYFSWLRYIGLGFLVLIEIKMMLFIFKLLYGREQENKNENITQQLSKGMDIPEWAARLMVLEANFWKRLWKIISSLMKRH